MVIRVVAMVFFSPGVKHIYMLRHFIESLLLM